MIKIDIKNQNSKKQFNFKKILRIGLVIAVALVVLGIIFSILPQGQPEQTIPNQPITPTEHYDISIEMLENANGYKYLKLTNTGKNIANVKDLLISSYPPEVLVNYGLPACSVSTVDFDFVEFNKDSVIYYYYSSVDNVMHISKSAPLQTEDLVNGRWRFNIIVKGNVINSKNYDVTDSKLKICDNNTNIASTIKSSSDYDTIIITGDEYYEHLIIDKPITLKSKTGTIINGGNMDNIITIESSNVYISGLTFKNSGMNLYDSAIMGLYKADVTITNCIFEDNANGIYLEYCNNFKIYNNILRDNSENGVFLDHSDTNLIRANTLYNNKNGIYVIESDYNYIKENSVNNHNEYGIFIEKHGAFENICEYNYWGNDDCYCNKIIVPTDKVIFQNDPDGMCGAYSRNEDNIISDWDIYKSEVISVNSQNAGAVGYYDF